MTEYESCMASQANKIIALESQLLAAGLEAKSLREALARMVDQFYAEHAHLKPWKSDSLQKRMETLGADVFDPAHRVRDLILAREALSHPTSHWTRRAEALEAVAKACNQWRTNHVCCPKDCPDLHDAQKNLCDAIDALAALSASEAEAGKP